METRKYVQYQTALARRDALLGGERAGFSDPSIYFCTAVSSYDTRVLSFRELSFFVKRITGHLTNYIAGSKLMIRQSSKLLYCNFAIIFKQEGNIMVRDLLRARENDVHRVQFGRSPGRVWVVP